MEGIEKKIMSLQGVVIAAVLIGTGYYPLTSGKSNIVYEVVLLVNLFAFVFLTIYL